MVLNGDFLTPAEAADIIGCTVGRVHQLLKSKQLAGKKFSERAWAVNRKSAEAYAKLPQTTGRPRKFA